MPTDVENALMKAFSKRNAKLHGKSKKSMVYATLTNMQKKGEIAPWRTLKRKAVGGGGSMVGSEGSGGGSGVSGGE